MIKTFNHGVKFGLAEIVLICDLDYLIKHQFVNNDSSHNKAEPIQSYGGDAISDGGNLEYKEEIDGLMEHEMAFEEHECHKLELMKFNAFKVCNELTSRMDVAPKPNGFMKS